MATVAQIAIRALRRFGIAASDVPLQGALTTADVAQAALRRHGIMVAPAARPGVLATVGTADIARRALRMMATSPASVTTTAGSGATYAPLAVMQNVFRQMGIPVAPGLPPPPMSAVSYTEVADRALLALGINPLTVGSGTGSAATFTVAQVGTEALVKLAIYAPDDLASITAADQATATARATDAHDMLVALDYVSWAGSAIPSAFFEWYVVIASQLLAPYFGHAATPDALLMAREQIRQMALTGVNAVQLARTRVLAVHEELGAMGIASWTANLIPTSYSEQYTQLAVARLAPIWKGEGSEETKAAVAMREPAMASILSGTRVAAARDDALQYVTSVHDSLVARDFVTWTVNAIPSAAFNEYVDIVIVQLGADLGREVPAETGEKARMAIRRVALSGDHGQVIAEQQVGSVHEELNALGIVSWPVTAIPAAFADEYARMAASMLAPSFDGGKTDVAAHEAAIASLRTASRIATVQSRALQAANAIHAMLFASDYVFWPATNIPQQVFEPYVEMTAARLSPEFDRPMDGNVMAAARLAVRRVIFASSTGVAIASDKVRAVHFGLDARGLARWTLLDIPDYVEEPYVLMTASILAPEVDARADPAWFAEGEMQVRKVIAQAYVRTPMIAEYF